MACRSSRPAMLERGRPPALIINTGSKQGITCPPGDTAYNVSKAGVKVLTEALAHGLRNEAGANITAHLLIPGHVFTALTARGRSEKPPGAWTAEQTVDFMVAGIEAGDFYVLCPDNDVDRASWTSVACCGPPATSWRTAPRCRAGIRIMLMPSRRS